MESLESRRLLATLAVNTTADGVDADPGDGVCEVSGGGACTLRAAIQEANALANVDGPDRINLPSGTYTFSLLGSDEQQALTGDLDITDDLVLQGAGAASTILDADGMDRVIDIVRGTVEIQGVTIRGGSIEDDELTVESSGGGIRNEGRLTITESTVTGNVAAIGAGIANYNGTLKILRSVISGNGDASTSRGGGVANDSNYDPAYLEITDSTISGNLANAGGGVSNRGYDGIASATILRSTLSGNMAQSGGGISNRSIVDYGETVAANLTILGSTISGNTADSAGGGIHSQADDGTIATVQIANATITANAATSGDGGGIAIENSAAASIELISAIVSGNNAGGQAPDIASGATTATFNLIGSGEGHSIVDGANNNLVGQDPLLGPLADNGGLTQTHTLLEGSPAIDQGSNPNLLVGDQRGTAFARTVDDPVVANASDGTDIGAVEIGQLAATLDFGDAPEAISVGGTLRQYPTRLAANGGIRSNPTVRGLVSSPPMLNQTGNRPTPPRATMRRVLTMKTAWAASPFC